MVCVCIMQHSALSNRSVTVTYSIIINCYYNVIINAVT